MRVDASFIGLLGCLVGNAHAQGRGAGSSTSGTQEGASTTVTTSGDPAMPASTGAPEDDNPLILTASEWSNNAILNAGDRAVWNSQDNSTLKFTWAAAEGSQVTTVNLYCDNNNNPQIIATGDIGGGSGVSGPSRRDGTKDGPVPINVFASSITIEFAEYLEDLKPYLDKVLYMEFQWEESGPGVQGSQFSPAMALSESKNTTLELSMAGYPAFPTQFTTAPVSTITSSAPATVSASTTATQASSSATSSSNSDAASGGGGGLSTGAIAGIAVACGVVGLALIGLGIFFCLRRRRSSDKVRDVNYGSDAGNNVMMAEKDMPGITESSPHSTYADDGGRLHDRHQMAMPHDQGAFVPYSDGAPAAGTLQRSQSDLPLQSEASNSRNRSPSPAVTSRYAHLVEEGMTEDEIRRLEEEERQLDAAIQEAGERRSAKPSS